MANWSAFPVGTVVRCANPAAFKYDVVSKLRDRTGTVARHQAFSGAPIVEFPAVGRRKAYRWVPSNPAWIEVVKEEV